MCFEKLIIVIHRNGYDAVDAWARECGKGCLLDHPSFRRHHHEMTLSELGIREVILLDRQHRTDAVLLLDLNHISKRTALPGAFTLGQFEDT